MRCSRPDRILLHGFRRHCCVNVRVVAPQWRRLAEFKLGFFFEMPSDDENAPARASPDLPPRNDILYAPALSLWRHWRLALEGLRVSEEESAEREQSDATITKADFYNLDDIATSAIFGTDGWVDVGTQPILLGRMDVLALAAVLRPLLSPWRHESAVIYPLVGQTAAAALKFSVKRTKLLEVFVWLANPGWLLMLLPAGFLFPT